MLKTYTVNKKELEEIILEWVQDLTEPGSKIHTEVIENGSDFFVKVSVESPKKNK